MTIHLTVNTIASREIKMHRIFTPINYIYSFHDSAFSENNCFLQMRKKQNTSIPGRDSSVIA